MATQAEVFGAVISERMYQDTKWTDLDKVNTLVDFRSYMDMYMDKSWTVNDEALLDVIRKVTALGFAAMEKFGAPQREGFPVTVNQMTQEEMARQPINDDEPVILRGDFQPVSVDTDDDGSWDLDDVVVPTGKLTPQELDELVPDGKIVDPIERGRYYRVDAHKRTYYYRNEYSGSEGETHRFYDIIAFAVLENGAHRLVNSDGTFYYVQPGWTVLESQNPTYV